MPYLDFNGGLGLHTADFSDHAQLRHSGRMVWQTELTQELAALYQRGALPDRSVAGQ